MKFGVLIEGMDVKVLLKLINDRLASIAAQSRAVGKSAEQYPGEKVALEAWRNRVLMIAKDMRGEASDIHEITPAEVK